MSVSAPRPVAAIVSSARSAAPGSWRRGVPRAVGLHHDHRQAVGHHVVHLPGDPGPLVQRRQLDLLRRLALDPLAALDQRVDVRPADPAEGAQRPGGDDDRGDGEQVGDRSPSPSRRRRTPPASAGSPPRRRRARCRGRSPTGRRWSTAPRSRARSAAPPAPRRRGPCTTTWAACAAATTRKTGERVAAPPEQRCDLGDPEHRPRTRGSRPAGSRRGGSSSVPARAPSNQRRRPAAPGATGLGRSAWRPRPPR